MPVATKLANKLVRIMISPRITCVRLYVFTVALARVVFFLMLSGPKAIYVGRRRLHNVYCRFSLFDVAGIYLLFIYRLISEVNYSENWYLHII